VRVRPDVGSCLCEPGAREKLINAALFVKWNRKRYPAADQKAFKRDNKPHKSSLYWISFPGFRFFPSGLGLPTFSLDSGCQSICHGTHDLREFFLCCGSHHTDSMFHDCPEILNRIQVWRHCSPVSDHFAIRRQVLHDGSARVGCCSILYQHPLPRPTNFAPIQNEPTLINAAVPVDDRLCRMRVQSTPQTVVRPLKMVNVSTQSGRKE
jgi:hypothetical protein